MKESVVSDHGSRLREHISKYPANNVTALIRVSSAFLQQIGSLFLFANGYLPWFVFLPIYLLALLLHFMIFHDCGHGSFFSTKQWNKPLEWLESFMVLTPIDWTYKHAVHHGQSGDLSKNPAEWSDTIYFTVEQYKALPVWKRALYRIFRDPLFFYTAIPFLNWFVKYRIPFLRPMKFQKGPDPTLNSVINTSAAACYFGWVYWMFGGNVLGFTLFASYLTGLFGIVLFHLQHSFNPSYVIREGWNLKDSAMKGSSVLTIPWFLKWWLMGIEYHHIHHYSTKVPGYNLQRCHEEAPPGLFEDVPILSYQQMFDSLFLALYHEKTQTYVTFSEAGKL